VHQFVLFAGDPYTWKTKNVEDYKQKLLSDGLVPKSINRKLVAIRRFIEYINTNGLKIDASVRIIKIQRQYFLEDVITPKNIEKMINIAAGYHDKLAVAIFASLQKTGCRVSELLQWRVSDIGKSTILVIGKGSKARDLIPPENLKYYLMDYAGERENQHEPLFINRRTHKPLTRQRVDQIIKKYAKLAKIHKGKAHAHSFRHQLGQVLMENGAKSEDVGDILGHNDANSTKIYTRSSMKTIKNIINEI
jgi:integrase/recombinase XerD